MTRRERLQAKLEKRQLWAESRLAARDAAFKASDLREEVSGIPLGQPILVGHHSERRHRRALERADNAMRKAHEHDQMAKHHASKAAGLKDQLAGTIFSDDPDAVEALEAKIEHLEAERQRNNAINKIVHAKPKNALTPDKIEALVGLGLPETAAAKLFEGDFCGRIGIPSYVNQNLGGNIKAARDRLVVVKAQKANREAAEASEDGIVIRTNTYGQYFVTFAEKPERAILTDLKAAGYRWTRGSWIGPKDRLPNCLSQYVTV